MRRLFLIALAILVPTLRAATNIEVSSNVVTPEVKRFGISGISHYYYDRILLKNLVWRNAGFEALLFQSMVRCQTGTSSGCIDTDRYAVWPTGHWNGGTYEFVLGPLKGRTGTITSSTAVPSARDQGTTWVLDGLNATPAEGSYFIARKYFPGEAESGWNPATAGGGTISTEFTDLPPGTDGRQCIRLSANATGQSATITQAIGAFGGSTFLFLNGTYRVTFKARAAGGSNVVNVSVARGSTPLLNQTVTAGPSWSTHTLDFSAAETPSAFGFISLQFRVQGASVLMDDVSMVQTNGDATNTSAFRDPVVNALRTFNPGSLRGHVLDLGQSLDDLVSAPFGRMRSQFHTSATNSSTNQYGWHEFLELCELVDADPYVVLPIALTDTEAANVIEYLAGPTSTPYGARRAARGHPAPWTESFDRIHIEFANETWNYVYLGANMFPADYGLRGSDLFGIMKRSPYYNAKFNLILGVQTANPFNSRTTHNASANHDMLAIAPYMATMVDDFESNERLYGGLFTESLWWSGSPNGFVRQTHDLIRASSRPVPMIVYEVNLHTTLGSISEEVLDSFTPSLGAGLAVADHMMNMLRHQQIRDQLVFSLGGYQYTRQDGKTALLWSITRDMGVTDRKRPQYLAVKLLNEVLGGNLVQTAHSGDNPTWNQPTTNRIAMDNVPYLRSFALVNGSRKSLVVFNMHRTAALDVTLSGANAPSGTVTMRRLTSANITDSNENAENVVITTQSLNLAAGATLSLPPFSMTVLSTADGVAPARLRGDVNGNGSVTAFDASMVLQAVVGSASLDSQQQCAADYNGNGSVSAFDASQILQCVVGGSCSNSTCN